MGAIKEKLIEISELIQDIIDSGIKNNEIDEILEDELSPEDYEFYHENKDVIFDMLGYMYESVNEALQPGIIRVFKSNRMKAFDSHDYSKKAIASVGKTYTIKGTGRNYYVTRVKLYDGSKGYVWPDELERIGIDPKTDKRNRFDESLNENVLNEEIEHGKWEGIDSDLETSLEEYGAIANQPETRDYPDEWFIIYKISDDAYDTGWIRESELNKIIAGKEWADDNDIEQFLNTQGMSKKEWLALPFIVKLTDMLGYWGYEEILGGSYDTMSRQEVYNIIEDKDFDERDAKWQLYPFESLNMPSIFEGCGGCKKNKLDRVNSKNKPPVKKSNPTNPKPRKKINERFKEKSDPIHDMGIGIIPKEIAKRFMKENGGNLERISRKYFKNLYKIGNAEVLYQFFRNIQFDMEPQKAFFKACENENYYGKRADIVEDRKEIADVIYNEFGIKVDPIFESEKDEYVMPSLKEYESERWEDRDSGHTVNGKPMTNGEMLDWFRKYGEPGEIPPEFEERLGLRRRRW
jgi:hypothetical protein